MAKYTVTYACGHGEHEENLFGPGKDRDSKIAWMESSMVCKDCYKAKMQAADAAAPMVASIRLQLASDPLIAIEVQGQIESHKQALYDLGYRWSDSSEGGMMGWLLSTRSKQVLAMLHHINDLHVMQEWITSQQVALAAIGYTLKNTMNTLDVVYLAKQIKDRQASADAKSQAQAKLAEIKATDPEPGRSPLRARIAQIEKERGAKWNGKIYGRKGYFNFYVADKNYSATDAEVLEREKIIAATAAWNAKYKAEIEAAK
jgi:hypothetical protein